MPVRNSLKAIVFDKGKILLTKNQDDEGDFYLFPGGGQEQGETFHDALLRECLEEAGLQVKIGELLFIREYIGKNHEHASFHFDFHQVEYFFKCHVKNEGTPVQPTNPDDHQVGIEWVSVDDLHKFRFYPKALEGYLMRYFNGEKLPIYLGDMN